MKSQKLLALLLISLIMICGVLTACGGGSEPPAEPAEPDPETAMNNFLAKLEAGNYVMTAENYLTTTVSSRDQVVFEYAEDVYNDFAAMSVDNESFQGFFEGDELRDVAFLGEGDAIDAAKKRLPNIWMDESVSGGNIWNLFYNDPDDPLRFTSHEETLKMNVLGLVGYSDNALRLMEDVYLVLDKEDPDTARIQCVVNEDVVARVNYDDIDIEITFGNAESNAVVDAWMAAPVYPEARTAWTEGDEFIFNSVFLPGYGLEAIPFTPFASYALMIDQENFVWNDEVRMRDAHATEKDMADYAALLVQNGFAEVKDTDTDGVEKTFYRKLLRADYDCYSSINLEYNDGVDIVARKYYECPTYTDLDAVNAATGAKGYPALPASDVFTSYSGIDRANEMTESWLYFFDYDLGLYVDMEYEDYDAAVAYMKDYEQILLDAGFTATTAEEEDEAETAELGSIIGDAEVIKRVQAFDIVKDAGDGGVSDVYESAGGSCNFRYAFNEDGKVSLLFKSQRYIAPDEAEKMIADAGFPAVELTEPITCRDLKLFRKMRYGSSQKAFITVSQEFESAEAAESFLSTYEAALNAAGFDRENPELVGSLKPIVIYNPETEMYVGIDYYPEQGYVSFEFSAE